MQSVQQNGLFQSDTTYLCERAKGTLNGQNIIWNQYNRMVSDIENNVIPIPEVIMFFAGVNDAHFNSGQFGTIEGAWNGDTILDKDVTTLTTLTQSVRYVCEAIKKNYPSTQIIICTPVQTSRIENTKKVSDILKQCADMLSVQVIDVNARGGYYSFFDTKGDYILSDNDAVHPNNSTGHPILARFIQREMKSKVNLRSNISDVNHSKLISISAVYNTNHTALVGEEISSLSQYITVTANYEDNSSKVIPYFAITGDALVEGENTLTISYSNQTTTLVVNASTEVLVESSITATYNQGDIVVKDNATLESLKDNLTVTVNYTNGSSSIITDYSLSGALTVGESTITVTHNNLATTFTVNVTATEITYGEQTPVFYNPVISETTEFTSCTAFNKGQIVTMKKYFVKQTKVEQLQFKAAGTGSAKIYVTKGFTANFNATTLTIEQVIEIPVDSTGVHVVDTNIIIPEGGTLSILANGVIGYVGNTQQSTAEDYWMAFSSDSNLDLNEGDTFATGSAIKGYMALSATVRYAK